MYANNLYIDCLVDLRVNLCHNQQNGTRKTPTVPSNCVLDGFVLFSHDLFTVLFFALSRAIRLNPIQIWLRLRCLNDFTAHQNIHYFFRKYNLSTIVNCTYQNNRSLYKTQQFSHIGFGACIVLLSGAIFKKFFSILFLCIQEVDNQLNKFVYNNI